MKRTSFLALSGCVLLCCAAYFGRSIWHPVYLSISGKRSETDFEQTRRAALMRVKPFLAKAGFTQTPSAIALLAFKQERRLELWAQNGSSWLPVKSYPILAASGKAGPKLREGDKQVPEGIYQVSFLNPNSNFHLSMKLNYPNAFDLQKAALDKRDPAKLGGDICIHGWEVSVGCIAIGNVAIEELYFLADRVGARNVKVLIAPNDLRRMAPITRTQLPWLNDLYGNLKTELQAFTVRTRS
ncbi:MAG TPA: L,D-transpeptidase family protein [Planctomycetota bacterium]|nr:L,D-transpeptidase family protein [Planctomycetota bacterium]